jgi:hypothetical protein
MAFGGRGLLRLRNVIRDANHVGSAQDDKGEKFF